MRADFYPLQVLLLTISGWVNRRQQDMIAYLVEEDQILKEQSRGRKIRLTNDQRRRLAAKAKRLGRQSLNRVARSTIAKVLKENGIQPAPDRPSRANHLLPPVLDRFENTESLLRRDNPESGRFVHRPSRSQSHRRR
jgi:hypothetical protein